MNKKLITQVEIDNKKKDKDFDINNVPLITQSNYYSVSSNDIINFFPIP